MDLNRYFNNVTESDINELVQAHESTHLEFKERVTTVLHLSRIVSAFGNASGGVVLIGVRESPREVIGCDAAKLTDLVARVRERVRPIPEIRMHVVNYNGKKVGVVVIKAMPNDVVVSDGGAFIRRGEKDVAMSAADMQSRLTTQIPEVTNQHLLEVIDTLNAKLISVHEDVKYPRSWRGRGISLAIAFAAGFFARLCADLVNGWLEGEPD
jgi:predicted HTH transcriptional regulator